MGRRIIEDVKITNAILPSEGVAAATPGEGLAAHTIEDVRDVAVKFLKKQPDVKRVNVTKLAQIDPEKGCWEVEAEVYVPNATIQALGLPVQKEVLDCKTYLLRVDGLLNVTAYGLRDLVAGESEIENELHP
ncbi:MAG TPA: hypothetical protein ACFYD7_06360 [Candidatus Wujingus californicus]|uniref:hypothetical protein n=1 Tax=Candidatus Wujingus californicus TaxID=3367618 RepID=UPI001E12F358|nr:hypothetical protein [Planctomycetota bacterium]MDO8130786.1 hypothetical protein [Candidatus Brocadiales bacterium]